MLPLKSLLRAGLVAGLACLVSSAASALSIEALATPFTGSDTSVQVVLTEVGGDVRVDLSVEEGQGDLRGIFFHVADASLLAGLSASGESATGFGTGDVINLGFGNNLNGGGSPCLCDIGVALGTPGIGKDDLQTASFLISLEGGALSLAVFSEQWIGVRVTSVGDGERREGSSKLKARLSAVPEPSTALLVGIGLIGMTRMRRTSFAGG